MDDTTLTQLKYQSVNWKRVFFCSIQIPAKNSCRIVPQMFKSYLKQALGRLAKQEPRVTPSILTIMPAPSSLDLCTTPGTVP